MTQWIMRWIWKGKQQLQEEDGVGVIEIALILVVLIALVLIFKSQLQTLIKNIFTQITNKTNAVY